MILLIVPAVCASLLTAFWFHRSSRRTNGKLSAPVASVVLLRRMLTDERVGRGTKTILALPVCYLLSPIQVIPNFIPVLGQLDDVLVVVVCLRIAVRRVPLDLLRELWPGEPAALDRLLRLPPSSTPRATPAARDMPPDAYDDEALYKDYSELRCQDHERSADLRRCGREMPRRGPSN